MRKVMLVEDEEFILEGLRNILDWEALGMRVVHTACNGAQALELWEKEKVDIIVTDIDMPVMDGLEFIKKLRQEEKRARCILLTGYDEFDYARRAITMDVEDYILKPINEEELQEVLRGSDEKLRDWDRKQAEDMDDKAGWTAFLRGKLSGDEQDKYISVLPALAKGDAVRCALMKFNLESLKTARMSDALALLQTEENIRVIYLSADTLLLLVYGAEAENEDECLSLLGGIQNRMESLCGILTFISLGSPLQDYRGLPGSYGEARRLQKYQIIEGCGVCVSQSRVNRAHSSEVTLDRELLRRKILQKDREGAAGYVEDLFINYLSVETKPDDFYHMCIQVAMLLMEIKTEYGLLERKNMRNLTELVEHIYQAENLFAIKTIFIGEVSEIVSCLHEEDSQYTPVVKRILGLVRENYREDMNLKTLACKFNMNASYLGQIFQKEVGCSFNQYLSNTKNSIAKDLILNTDMRISDIAREVGYAETNYFYRKFKQCYGVSPASLRELKKY